MKREIKFRCWNRTNSRMVDLYKATPLALDPNLNQDGLFIPYDDSLILMQFTGLKDKNGKEIYEGDILECGEDKPVLVQWNKYLSSFGVKKEGWMYMHFFGEAVDSNNCAVIGNIYEHPHLLIPTTSNNEIK